jgi:hypothetical protein
MLNSPETLTDAPGDVQETPVGAEHDKPLEDVPGVVNDQLEIGEIVRAF